MVFGSLRARQGLRSCLLDRVHASLPLLLELSLRGGRAVAGLGELAGVLLARFGEFGSRGGELFPRRGQIGGQCGALGFGVLGVAFGLDGSLVGSFPLVAGLLQVPLGLLAHLADGALAVLSGLVGLVADALGLLSGLAAHRGHGGFGFVAGGFAVLFGLLARVLGGLVLVVAFLAGAFGVLVGFLGVGGGVFSRRFGFLPRAFLVAAVLLGGRGGLLGDRDAWAACTWASAALGSAIAESSSIALRRLRESCSDSDRYWRRRSSARSRDVAIGSDSVTVAESSGVGCCSDCVRWRCFQARHRVCSGRSQYSEGRPGPPLRTISRVQPGNLQVLCSARSASPTS